MTSNTTGNILSRLQGLKNVSGRRVMPGSEFLDEPEEEADFSGTASQLPRPVSENLPQLDTGGELPSQDYDVRANSVIVPEEPAQEKSFFSNLGSALGKLMSNEKKPSEYFKGKKYESAPSLWDTFTKTSPSQIPNQAAPQVPPIETAQTDIQEGLPPVTESEQKYIPATPPETFTNPWKMITNYLSPEKWNQQDLYNKQNREDSILRAQGKDPKLIRQQKIDQLNADNENKDQYKYSGYGSAEEIANSPVLQAQFKEFTGTDFKPQIAAQVKEYEAAMKGVEDALTGNNTQLNERAEGIRERILNNQANDADKYFIGLALLMPLIIGGVYGKEAGLGALGGGAQGIADVLNNRQKQIREDEASLLDINKQQGAIQEKMGNMALERAKLEPTIRKNLPEDPNKHLIGMRRLEFNDPVTEKPTEAYEVLPGFVAKSQFVNTEKGRDRMEKAAVELSDTKSYVEQINDLTEDILDILGQLKDKPWWKKAHISSLSAVVPGSLSGLTDNVNYKGQLVPAGPLLENKLGILHNQYAHAQDLGQLDRAAQSHMEKIASNPTKTLLTPKDVETQILSVRNFVQNELVKRTKNKGFYPEFVIRDMESANNPLFSKLNQKENDKQVDKLTKNLIKNESSYAK